ncbi:4-coumarate--CoA ligase-like 2 [Armadillidium vulgare]|nr:4-coumarate--CoA ligase-like 2 [Armadillidium vulgare]
MANKTVTCLIVIPTLLNILNMSPKCTEETIRSLNTVFCGGDPIPRSSIEAFRKKFKLNIDILEAYAMTETLVVSAMPRNCKNFEGCGRLLSNVEAKIICTETGETLGPNQTGEIYIKTPSVMKGYFNNREATYKAFQNGWLRTGDIGYFDENEFLFVTDRLKNMIKVHGCQVSPSEIENELQKHPLVEECCVIGKPDLKHGNLPLAFVIAKEKVSEEELQNFMKDKLSEFKQLTGGIKFVESLPKSGDGKILKRELKLQIE